MEQNFSHLLRGIITGCLLAVIVLSLAGKAKAHEMPRNGPEAAVQHTFSCQVELWDRCLEERLPE